MYVDLIKRHAAAGKLIFTTCTGASALATTGVLDGKNATVNHVEFNYVKRTFPKVKWSKEKQWVVDDNIWTAGGAVAGMDMLAHWCVLVEYRVLFETSADDHVHHSQDHGALRL